jgi:multiple sugar transport system permease protein
MEHRHQGPKSLLPYILILPTVVVMLSLVYYPIAETLRYSFQAMDLLKPAESGFVGFENYVSVLHEPSVQLALFNSIFVFVLVLAITVIIGLFIAFVLLRNFVLRGVIMAVVILPWALPGIVNGILWRGAFHPHFGVVNLVLRNLGVVERDIAWLSEPTLVLVLASCVVAWRTVPLAAFVFLASLQNIPTEYYESASVDGCSSSTAFIEITLPLLRPPLAIVLTLTSIMGINVFEEIIALTGFGGQTRTAMIEIYLQTFKFLDFGKGSALTYFLMAVSAVIAYIYIRHVNKGVEYL